MNENTGENKIECVCRRYRVQTPGGMVVEVESTKPLSMQETARLLEEDSDVDDFFKSHKILAIRQLVHVPHTQQKESPRKSVKRGTLSPRQRLNQLLKLRGEFTRADYIKYLRENFQYNINRWTSYSDIQDALRLHKIEIVSDKKGTKGRIYRVISEEEVEESLYQKLLQDRKLHISTLA